MKKGYWVSLYFKIDNQENIKKYSELATPIIKSYGGVPLVKVENMKLLMEMISVEPLCGNFQVMLKHWSVILLKNIKIVGQWQKKQQKDICKLLKDLVLNRLRVYTSP